METIRLLNGLGETLKTLNQLIPDWKFFNIRQDNDKQGCKIFTLFMSKDEDIKEIFLDEDCRLSIQDLRSMVKIRDEKFVKSLETKGVKNIEVSYHKDDHHDNYKVLVTNKTTKEGYCFAVVYKKAEAEEITQRTKYLLENVFEIYRQAE